MTRLKCPTENIWLCSESLNQLPFIPLKRKIRVGKAKVSYYAPPKKFWGHLFVIKKEYQSSLFVKSKI